MRFSERDIRWFARWSRDCNPLHTDAAFARTTPFGRPIAHGMLSVFAGLAERRIDLRGSTLDIEFGAAVVPDVDYDCTVSDSAAGTAITVSSGDGPVLTIRVAAHDEAATRSLDGDWTWAQSMAARGERPSAGVRAEPAMHSADGLASGVEIVAEYATDDGDAAASAVPGAPLDLGARVLALCSYVVGMEVPGRQSLFTRATVEFASADSADGPLWYRARTVRFDRHFRMLETKVDVATTAGAPVATAVLRSYVPLGRVVTNVEDIAASLDVPTTATDGCVALVCGGSRGLGADLSLALAVAGWKVYVAARSGAEAAAELAERVGGPGALHFVAGDVGDPDWCRDTVARIVGTDGRLDLLVLNACAAPASIRVASETAVARDAYVRDNLRLVQTPLTAAIDALEQAQGTVVYVSSSVVDKPVAGWSHYVALKQAGEGLVRTVQQERPRIHAVIARPARLQTTWSDTPAAIATAIPAWWAAVHVVNRVAASWRRGGVDVISDFPPLDAAPQSEPQTGPAFPLRVTATFTTDPLIAGLKFWLKELGVAGDLTIAPYGQVLQTLLDPASPLSGRGGLNVVLLRVRDWLHELPADKASSIEFVRGYLQNMVRDTEAALRAHRARAGAETLLVFCPSYGAASAAESILLRQSEAELRQAVEGLAGLDILSAADFHRHYGVDEDAVSDEVREKLAHIPYRDDYYHVLATIVARRAHRRVAPLRKVVVVDCDNTLWRGVVGEVGAEGIAFDEAHVALAERLNALAESGVLVCLCSKNEESDVWPVFETRPDFRLRRDTVVAAAINWQLKSENLRSLAARLNLGIDSFVFIDDNPVECAEVRSRCPEVLTLEWPTDSPRALRLLDHAWELEPIKATAEDQKRTQMYRDEFRRQELRQDTLTFADFIGSLALEVELAPLADADRRRAAQLTLRTNQFNFTTRRREETEVVALAAGSTHDVRTVRVRDRFGDYGLVGLLIAEAQHDVLMTDTFLLSCRVLGRGVEHQMAAALGRLALDRGLPTVRMRVETTKRNTPARKFLEAIAPEDLRQADAAVLECDFPAARLAALRFEPTVQPGYVPEDVEGASNAPAAMTAAAPDADRLRRREVLIARTAFELTDASALSSAIDRRSPSDTRTAAAPREAAGSTSVRRSADVDAGALADVASVVHRAFADALRVPAATVEEVDNLESLGCSSMKIVEITVGLLERYPALPSTLLFEHRSVSSIVREIARIVAGADAPPVAHAAAADAAGAGALYAGALDIAVVGMHVRCAGADSPSELWELLSGGRSAVREVPIDRPFFLRPLQDDRPHWAGLLDDVARFDAELFGISPREAVYMDPQLRLFLEVAWAAIEDAGAGGRAHDPNTGVFAGVMYGDYRQAANVATSGSPYRCWEGFSLANRLSQLLGFHGPSLAVDTACSSSGTALHLACRALRAGDCRTAIVGGLNIIVDPDRFASLGRLGILSARGRCEPFGADADGTVLGEGAGVVVLRPLADALERGDRIYGVIKGTGLSTGSGTVGFTAPNPQAQAEAIARSVRSAGIDPRTITYVETHGTGTVLGDPIEVRGLTLAYGRAELHDPSLPLPGRCAIGSIKPNVGHLEAGAGVVALIKVLLQFTHGTLLPSLTSDAPNPHIPFDQSPFAVQRTLAPWERLRIVQDGVEVVVPRRAGVSSFGVGGANAHIIIEEPPVAERAAAAAERPAHVLAISARSDDALRRRAAEMGGALTAAPESVADFCYSANVGHQPLDERLAVIASSADELADRLTRAAEGGDAPAIVRGRASAEPPRVAFLFTGQGSQYAGMGRELYQTQPVFRDALDRCALIFDRLLGEPLLELLFAAEGSDQAARLNETGFTQPALFAFEYALSELWRSFGVIPDVVMGHSVGEIAAMCVAGGVSLDDGLKLIAARGRLMQALPAGGTMTSVMAAEDRVLAAIAGAEEQVAIAAINAPTQVVISGAGVAVAEIAARLEADGIRTKPLTVSHAFHSPLMKPMLAEFEAVVREIRFSAPAIPFISCVDGAVLDDEVARPEYWLRQVMQPVRFAAGMAVLEEQGARALVEIGPHPVLLGMGRQCVGDRDETFEWLPSLRRDADGWSTLLASVSRLYVNGTEIDWRGFDAPYARRRITLPEYPFSRRQYWLRDVPVDGDRLASSSRTAAPTAPGAPEGYADAYRLVWERCGDAAASGKEVESADRYVIFSDHAGVGAQLAILLGQRMAETTIVLRGDHFSKGWDGDYELNPDRPDDFTQLWAELASNGASSVRVLYLWAVDAAPASEHTTAVAEAARSTLATALYLTQAAARANVRARLWLVTRGAVNLQEDAAVQSGAAIALAQAPLWGFARTVALEHPDLWGGIVDLAPQSAPGDLPLLLDRIAQPDADDQIALREGTAYVPRLVSSEQSESHRVAPDGAGTYLVTGGVGALGLAVAEWLVSKGARHLVLASRRGATESAAASRIAALEAAGAQVRVVAADVASAPDVDRVLADIAASGVPLRGVVHAAGVDAPAALSALTRSQLDAVLAAKAAGGWLLHDRTKNLPLDLFVCFSSLASVLGSQGRAHYAAANAFLDALVGERRRLGLPALAINWGPWSGGGMADSEQLLAFERIGNYGLVPRLALARLDQALTGQDMQVAIADVDWQRFRQAYELRRPRPLVGGLTLPAARPRRRAQSSSMPVSRVAPPATAAAAVEPGSAPAAADTSVHADWVRRLMSVAEAERPSVLEALVRQEVADTLGSEQVSRVPADRTFQQLGMDSLLTAELVGRLRKRVGFSCSAVVFDHPTVAALTSRLLEMLNGALSEVSAPGGTGAVTASAMADSAGGSRPGRESIAATRGELMALLRGEINDTLGYERGRELRTDVRFADLGMDSLLAAEFAGRLKKKFAVSGAGIVFDHPTLESLTAHLSEHLRLVAHSEPPAATGSAAITAPASLKGITRYEPQHDAQVVAFQKKTFPDRHPDWILPRWHWMFVQSANRVARQPQAWLYHDRDAIVGHMGAIPVRLKIADASHDAAWLVDTMVLERYRGQGIGAQLLVHAHEELPVSLSLGQSAEMREIQFRLGWQQVAPLQVAQLLIRPEKVLKRKLGRSGAWAAGIVFRASGALRELVREGEGADTHEVARFDGTYDRLWDEMSAAIPCGVIRDASFLNWKYVDQPVQTFLRLAVVDDGVVRGAVVLMFRDADAGYPYRRAFLVDLIAPLTNDRLLRRVISVAAAAAAQHGADSLTCMHTHPRLTEALTAAGFRMRPATRFLLVDPVRLPAAPAAIVTAADGWHLMQGDADIDRPGQ